MLRSILITFFSFLGISAALGAVFHRQIKSWSKRDFLLFAILVWGSFLCIQLEILSLFKSLDRHWLILSWGTITVIAWGIWLIHIILNKELENILKKLKEFHPYLYFAGFDGWEWVYLGIILFIIFTLAMVAYVYPPNTYDSMTYHLPRVMHWVQAHSLYPYPTSIERQIQMQPMAEFLILDLDLLSGTDRLFNFVQLGALIVSLIGVSSIASKLGLGKRLQIITALLCISIPMGLLQATSTQNDLVLACWLVCFVSLGLSLVKEPTLLKAIPTGLALGLSILTKATAYVFALPFCVYFGIVLLRKAKGRAIYIGAVLGLLAILINIGHYSRIWLVYHSPLGPTEDYTNELINLNAMTSNAIRNIALNFIPSQSGVDNPIELNQYVQSWLRLAHKITGLAPDDPRTSWIYTKTNVFDMVSVITNEDNIGNPLHTGLIFLAIIILLIRLPLYLQERFLIAIILCASLAFGLYCLLFRWQDWGTRLLLPLLILWMPILASLLFSYKEKWILLAPIILALVGVIAVFKNPLRPIVPPDFDNLNRINYAFNLYKPLFGVYDEITQEISESGCDRVGLKIGSDTWEYPFWTLLKFKGFSGEIEHIQVKNLTSKFEDPGFQPCAVIIQNEEPEIYATWEKHDYGEFNLYIRP